MNLKERYEQTVGMAAEYEGGSTLRDLAAKYSMSVEGVAKRLKNFGVKMRPKSIPVSCRSTV